MKKMSVSDHFGLRWSTLCYIVLLVSAV